jgi:hypothetical protein
MSDEQTQLEALRAGLTQRPSELALADLIPLFVPTTFLATGVWPGPFENVGVPGLGLTWAVLQPQQTMRYVDHEAERYWDSCQIPWRTSAIENVQRRSVREVWTHEFRRENGSPFAVAMMHADGVGPSRLLLYESLESLFPEGYLVALPEMSCGLVLSAVATRKERHKIEDLVRNCFRDGTRPLVEGLHEARVLKSRSYP